MYWQCRFGKLRAPDRDSISITVCLNNIIPAPLRAFFQDGVGGVNPTVFKCHCEYINICLCTHSLLAFAFNNTTTQVPVKWVCLRMLVCLTKPEVGCQKCWNGPSCMALHWKRRVMYWWGLLQLSATPKYHNWFDFQNIEAVQQS